jgi:hypothetical protein
VTLHGPCELSTRVGGFAVQLVETMFGNPAYTSVSGGVRNAVKPSEVWTQEGDAAGGCRMMVAASYSCTTPCTGGMICGGQDVCIVEPTFQSAGVVTVTGVGTSTLNINPAGNAYNASPGSSAAFPPFSPGARVTLAAAGATIPAFTLYGEGITPLEFAGTNLKAEAGKDFAFTWTAPPPGGQTRIFARMEIGHHGGVAARIECDLPDTGSGTIPAALVTALVAKGIHGFPELSLTRRTTDSTQITQGCVDLAVASPAARAITACTASGVCPVSCNCTTGVDCDLQDAPLPCAGGGTCKPDLTCP